MKRKRYFDLPAFFALLIQILLNSSYAQITNQDTLAIQEIRYSAKDAKEVFLVWGIDGWQFQEESLCPLGTYKQGNLMYSPMVYENGIFSTKLKVKPNTRIDYVFWITKGPRNADTDIWDINIPPQEDYHSITLNNNITLIESNIKVRPKEPLTLLDFSWQLLLSMVVLLITFFIYKKYQNHKISETPPPGTIVTGFAVTLLLGLFFARASILGISWDLYLHPIEYLPQLFWAGFYDFLYVFFLTFLFLTLLFIFKNFPKVRSVLVYSYGAISIISLIAGILNVKIIQMLGKPFNFRLLCYSDFLKSADAKAAISANVSLNYILNIIGVCLAIIIASVFLILVIEHLNQKYRLQKVLTTSLVCLSIVYVVLAQKDIYDRKWDYDKLANPVFSFMESVNPFAQAPELFNMKITDSLKIENRPKKEISNRFERDKIKNVIVMVLESTASEYIDVYGSKFKTSPELEKNIPHSIVFENIYAHVPSTNKSMVCLLGSIYPWISYWSITQEHPNIDIPTISTELKKYGYRTAFFNSGDNKFQRGVEFLTFQKFDLIKDCRSMNCKQKFAPNDKDWDPLDGIDDECTGDELIKWINQEPGKPFFTMMWTYQTHYPYYSSEEEEKYNTSDPLLNRYLNAVSHSDKVLGKIIEQLKTNNLLESTLIVVVGDHGEAFGRHEQTAHASKIYEENLHIPCIFINPVFKNERSKILGGSKDIAPSIMNVLGLPANEQWQGKSLFAEDKNEKVYFFCPWADYLFGYRQGNKKFIYNATKETTEVYDLKNDPNESNNIFNETPESAEFIHQNIGAWVQYQKRFMEKTLNRTAGKNVLLP